MLTRKSYGLTSLTTFNIRKLNGFFNLCVSVSLCWSTLLTICGTWIKNDDYHYKKGAWVGRQKKRTTWITHPGLLKTIQRILVLINAITHRTVTNATPANIIVVSWSDNIIFTLKSIKLLTYMKSILTNTGAKLAHCLRTHKSFWSDFPLLFVFLTWINSFNFLYVESS